MEKYSHFKNVDGLNLLRTLISMEELRIYIVKYEKCTPSLREQLSLSILLE